MSLNLGFLFFLLWSSPALADGVLHVTGGSMARRSLLQANKGCPVDFEHQNYTIITAKCKGPFYPANLCCAALLEFACPFSNEINDLSNDCAERMFSYINLYGKYPPGLFASVCQGGKKGLMCDGSSNQTASESNREKGANKGISMMSIVILTAILAS